MNYQTYLYKQNIVIIGTNKATGREQEVSTRLTMNEAHRYVNTEYFLHKKYPSDFGLYGEHTNIKLKTM